MRVILKGKAVVMTLLALIRLQPMRVALIR